MSNIRKVNMTGLLVTFRTGFHEELESQGYTPLGAECQLRVMAHVSGGWKVGGSGPAISPQNG